MRHKRSPRRYMGAFAHRFFEALGAMAVIAGALAVFAPDLLKDRGGFWASPSFQRPYGQ